MTKLTAWAGFLMAIILELSSIMGIILAMLSKPYPFQGDIQPFPYAMIFIVLMFMLLTLMAFDGREQTT